MSLALVLGGGAPNMTLMSGSLAALDERGVEFDVVSTSGAGMLIGLLYAAARGKSRREALAMTRELGVSDPIYAVFPVNYKVFHKPGPMAVSYTKTLQPFLNMIPRTSPAQRLFQDWAELVGAVLCPSDLNHASSGLCQTPPWIEEAVDFEALRDFPGEFYLHAYSLDRHQSRSFAKHEIRAEHFNAGLAMPLIYPPYTLDGETYIEGSAMSPLNFDPLRERQTPVDRAVVIDIIGEDRLLHKPRSLYDSYVQSIITPLVRAAQRETETFIAENETRGAAATEVLKLDFADLIPEEHWPQVLDWTYSNMSLLYDVGYQAGLRFCDRYADKLVGKEGAAPAQAEPMALPTRSTTHPPLKLVAANSNDAAAAAAERPAGIQPTLVPAARTARAIGKASVATQTTYEPAFRPVEPGRTGRRQSRTALAGRTGRSAHRTVNAARPAGGRPVSRPGAAFSRGRGQRSHG